MRLRSRSTISRARLSDNPNVRPSSRHLHQPVSCGKFQRCVQSHQGHITNATTISSPGFPAFAISTYTLVLLISPCCSIKITPIMRIGDQVSRLTPCIRDAHRGMYECRDCFAQFLRYSLGDNPVILRKRVLNDPRLSKPTSRQISVTERSLERSNSIARSIRR